ncbi:MAG: 30S ribosomal protein S1 [Candidatus Marinimicrobia bacterium CG08_land_8_20_14_0_20_45_22]|nr:MAG: 30S ribosomal protein S1 [Candidatus Marinimicrobia bacterium CG08_land_8_20_14_0_20_45_22]
MFEEENELTPTPIDETAVPDESVETPAAEPVPTPVELPVAEYVTEEIKIGPYSEKIRVYNLQDLKDEAEVSRTEERLKYESSLKDISQEQRIIGTVVSVHENEILMDVGFKSEGVISRDEFEQGELPNIGDQIEVFVDTLEDESGQMILSKRKADFMRVWERVRQIYNNAEIVEGKVLNRIKGGMVVDIMGIDAFLPGSQIDVRPVTDFDNYVGKTFEFRIVKLNELRKNVVLSRKDILEESLKEKRDDLLSKIRVGDILTGRVKNITDFGVFVDLGGLDGLLHITDLSWGRVNHPREVVNLDDELTVKVIDYDSEKQRVSLGLKQLQPHPWEGIEYRYPIGTVVKGKVVNIANYGVFVEIEKGVEGLIHISEISWTQHIKHPSEIFTLNEMIEAKVLNVDSQEKKISLGFKQLGPDPWEAIEQSYSVGAIYKGIVRNLTPYGAFIELQEGIDGFVHISDMSWTKKLHHPREILKKGDDVEVKVLEVSKENRKIGLGMKQISEDPWTSIESLYVEGAIVEGEVARITDKLVIVNLAFGLEGIVPLGQVPKKDRKTAGKGVQIGEKLQLKVLEVNKGEKKVVLSREQAMPKKPRTDAEAYMFQQSDTSDKIEIPEAIIEKIAESEKEAEPAEELGTEKKKTVRKKAKAAEKPEQKQEESEEKPKKKSVKKAAEKKVVEASASEAETAIEEPKKAAMKRSTKTAKKKSESTEDEPETEKAESSESEPK